MALPYDVAFYHSVPYVWQTVGREVRILSLYSYSPQQADEDQSHSGMAANHCLPVRSS